LPPGVEVIDLSDLYETIFQRVSLSELEEAWFLEHLPHQNRKENGFRRISEIIVALTGLIITLPISILASLLIKLTSAGPIFYTQKRVGRQRKVFNLYKFRSMYHSKERNPDADDSKPTWTRPNDARITLVGRVLRATHIDELPQLLNIIKGDMSFIGPRPERPEFTAQLETQIPFYELRYILRPGITGWAQINFKYAASVDEAYEKLQYDIYYLKNQSFFKDLFIMMKTIKKIFS
ncbi:MAG: sugar transferase, partial [bacterium]|nr:sugar transferase [bacterium]